MAIAFMAKIMLGLAPATSTAMPTGTKIKRTFSQVASITCLHTRQNRIRILALSGGSVVSMEADSSPRPLSGGGGAGGGKASTDFSAVSGWMVSWPAGPTAGPTAGPWWALWAATGSNAAGGVTAGVFSDGPFRGLTGRRSSARLALDEACALWAIDLTRSNRLGSSEDSTIGVMSRAGRWLCRDREAEAADGRAESVVAARRKKREVYEEQNARACNVVVEKRTGEGKEVEVEVERVR